MSNIDPHNPLASPYCQGTDSKHGGLTKRTTSRRVDDPTTPAIFAAPYGLCGIRPPFACSPFPPYFKLFCFCFHATLPILFALAITLFIDSISRLAYLLIAHSICYAYGCLHVCLYQILYTSQRPGSSGPTAQPRFRLITQAGLIRQGWYHSIGQTSLALRPSS